MNFLAEMMARRLVADCTDFRGLAIRLGRGPITAYCGFDPTASSLHVGSLKPVWVLRRLQQMGHKAIVLIGGATGTIGDPSGRATDRPMLTNEDLDANREALRRQIESLIPSVQGRHDPIVVDNRDWLAPMTAIRPA